MSALTDTLIDGLNSLLASGSQIPASRLRAYEALVVGAIGTLEARARGNQIHYTSGVPSNALGLEGDLGVNKLTGDFYQFVNGQFVLLFNGTGKVGAFTPIAQNQFGTHPAFTNQDDLNDYLLGNNPGTTPTPAKPTITGFLPMSGAQGSTVVLTGTNFTGATLVSINLATVASFTVDSATRITAVLSGSQVTGRVRVTTAAGTGVSTTDFTVTVPAPNQPTITSFTPTAAAEGDNITITGTNFGATPGTAGMVKFNGILATVISWAATSIVVKVPTGGATGKITVKTSAGTATSATDFTVSTAATQLTPTAANLHYNTLDESYASGARKMFSAFSMGVISHSSATVEIDVQTTIHNSLGALPASEASISVYTGTTPEFADATWLANLVPTPDPNAVSVTQTFTQALPGSGLRYLFLVNGTTSRTNDDSANEIQGTIWTKATFPNSEVGTLVPWTKKAVQRIWCSDSTGLGIGTDYPAQQAAIVLLRQQLRTMDITAVNAWGGRELLNAFNSMGAFSQLIAPLVAADANALLFVDLGINDRNRGTTPAQLDALLKSSFTSLFGTYPGLQAMVGNIFLTRGYEGTNATGFTTDNYRQVLEDVTKGYANTTIYPARTSVSLANIYTDDLHITAAGNVEIYNSLLSTPFASVAPTAPGAYSAVNFSSLDAGVNFSNNVYAVNSSDNGFGHTAQVSGKIAAGQPGALRLTHLAPNNNGALVFATAAGRNGVQTGSPYASAWINPARSDGSADVVSFFQGGGTVSTTVNANDELQVVRNRALSVRLEKSSDGGATWQTVRFFGYVTGDIFGALDLAGVPNNGALNVQSQGFV